MRQLVWLSSPLASTSCLRLGECRPVKGPVYGHMWLWDYGCAHQSGVLCVFGVLFGGGEGVEASSRQLRQSTGAVGTTVLVWPLAPT